VEADPDDLALALELADIADSITLERYGAADLEVATKPDLTPVTEADTAVEHACRDRLGQMRPADGIVGEEYGVSQAGAGARRWIIDPIDGTKNFVRGIPVFATLIALEVEGRIQVGVVSAPALGGRWWAVRGGGAHASGRPLRVSAVASLEQAQLAYDSVPGFAVRGLEERFLGLARRCARSRGFGDFWSHVLVAEGCVEIAVEPEVSPWDLAPLLVIVEEAGGRFTDLEGRPRIDGGSAVASNGLLHDQVLEALRQPC
jgi:histidinol-phosphatase